MYGQPTGGWVWLGDSMEIKVWHWRRIDGPRWVLSVNGFIVRIDPEERVIRKAAQAYYLRGQDPVGESA